MILEVSLGRPLDTFFWALIISCSRVSARVKSGPMCRLAPMHPNVDASPSHPYIYEVRF